jgi:hypothetical protein
MARLRLTFRLGPAPAQAAGALALVLALSAAAQPPDPTPGAAGAVPSTAGAAPSATDAAPEPQDLTLPPVIATAPGQPNLEPPPEDRDDLVRAVVTSGQSEFRLPDLGTSLREEREQEDPNQRIVANPIRLYDPEADPTVDDNFLEADVLRGVGFIKMFEFRFGRDRPSD